MTDHESKSQNAADPAADVRTVPADRNAETTTRSWFGGLNRLQIVIVACLFVAFAWSYWPTFQMLVKTWETQPDYSHGYFVLPIALWFLWVRRDRFPVLPLRPAIIGGLALVLLSACVRYAGSRFFVDSLDGWSIMVWTAGVIAALAGWRVLIWCLPSVLFMWFMVPMPYRLESAFRQPLQELATKISCATLVVLGQPAIAEGNVIRIGTVQFGIEEACSGLRIFVGIAALAFAYIVVVHRSWLIKGLLLLAILPVTLVANTTRIVSTCLLYNYSEEWSYKFSHDIAGFLMIPFAAVLFGLVLLFLRRLLPEVPVTSVSDVIRRDQIWQT